MIYHGFTFDLWGIMWVTLQDFETEDKASTSVKSLKREVVTSIKTELLLIKIMIIEVFEISNSPKGKSSTVHVKFSKEILLL